MKDLFTTLLACLLMALLTACATTRPRPADVPPLTSRQDSVGRDSLLQLPPYLVPPPLGSTPTQARKWHKAQRRNLARAGHLPLRMSNSALATAPDATAAVVKKTRSPVAVGQAAEATDFRKAAQRGGALAVGDGAQAVATTKKPFPWWVLLVAGVLLVLNRLLRGRWLL